MTIRFPAAVISILLVFALLLVPTISQASGTVASPDSDKLVAAITPDSSFQVITLEPSDVTPVSATLNGELVSLGTFSTVQLYFEWGQDTSYGNITEINKIQFPASFSAVLTGLTPGTLYHYRAVAIGDGTLKIVGEDVTFTPLLTELAVSTGQAEPGIQGAELIGDLTGFGASSSVEVFFEFGESPEYGNTSDRLILTNNGPFNIFVDGLEEHVTYHYRAVAVGDKTVTGEDRTFTPYAVSTGEAVVITPSIAVLTGNINRFLVFSDPVPATFEWGTDTSYGNTVEPVLKSAGDYCTILEDLAPGTTYHFRARIDVAGDVYYGLDQEFTTPGLPSPSPSVQTDWYVSPEGDDVAGDGTRDMPFLSIWTAMDKAPRGSLIHILPGTYPGNLVIEQELVIMVY